ncbi:MAG: CAP domain-containing protein [Candidatus Paceibacterota bacterium]
MKIFRKIKNLFLPTEDNNHVPLMLSESSFYIVMAIAFSIIIPTVYTQTSYFASLIGITPFSENEVVELLNNSRVNNGLSELKISDQLSLAAQNKLNHMVQNGYFSHFAPDGTSPWYFIKSLNYEYSAAGENLAVDFATAESTHNALMRSPSHRSNILSNLYSEIGVAVARASYQDREAIYVVQMFGNPEPQTFSGEALALAIGGTNEPSTEPQQEIMEPLEEEVVEEINEPEEVEEIGIVESATGSNEVNDIEEEPKDEPLSENQATSSQIIIEKDTPISLGMIIGSYFSSTKSKALTSVLVIVFIATSLLFLLTREHRVDSRLIARSFMVIIIFSFLIFQSYYEVSASRITPFAQKIISYELVK